MGAQTDLTAGELRWLSPFPLWTGVLAGPIAWAIDLTASYALVKWVCATRHEGTLHLITFGALGMVAAGAAVSWLALRQTAGHVPTDAGHSRARARFMSILGLAMCALFALTIVAGAIPRWMLDACQ